MRDRLGGGLVIRGATYVVLVGIIAPVPGSSGTPPPVGAVTKKDIERFASAFAGWDTQAIWGGSFVTKETL